MPISVNSSLTNYLNIREASKWASEYLQKNVSSSNISYLIQYGRINKNIDNGNIRVDIQELKNYYDRINHKDEKNINGNSDINWRLSFEEYKESERTKHVHRLHPYKGKFIPQLVEYFLDNHTDEYKRYVSFQPGDIILDPFCGSGTTLVQANELGIHAIGIDISSFNSLISNVKIDKHNLTKLHAAINSISTALREFNASRETEEFDHELLEELFKFNNEFFPSPSFRQKVHRKEIDEFTYAMVKEKEFIPIYQALLQKYHIKTHNGSVYGFLDKWYLPSVREEIELVFNIIKTIKDEDIKKITAIILSRTIRSCRATTHADLGTLLEPITKTYYCKKHGKICKPLFSIQKWWGFYSLDTVNRLKIFQNLRTETYQHCFTGDSRVIDLDSQISLKKPELYEIYKTKRITGIFTSPPYLGLIDYHEQHAYAYELFGFKRQDDLEIGALSKGQNREAQQRYINDISEVLIHCKKYLAPGYEIFIVANDKHNLYPLIANISGLEIIKQFNRPVLNRVEKDRAPYSETIFQLRGKNE